MVTKKTVITAVFAALVAGNAHAMLRRSQIVEPKAQPTRGLTRRTAGFVGRMITSRPVMFITGCLSYPLWQKTLFADKPLLDWKALAAYVSNKWENNGAKASVNAQNIYNSSSETAHNAYANSTQWLQNFWSKAAQHTQDFYNHETTQNTLEWIIKNQKRAAGYCTDAINRIKQHSSEQEGQEPTGDQNNTPENPEE